MKQINSTQHLQPNQICQQECLICCDEKPNATTNSCDHKFCSTCLMKWSKSKRTCPICRKHYTGLKITRPTRPKVIKKTIFKQKVSMVRYELMCSAYLNVENNIVPVIQPVLMEYSFDSYFLI